MTGTDVRPIGYQGQTTSQRKNGGGVGRSRQSFWKHEAIRRAMWRQLPVLKKLGRGLIIDMHAGDGNSTYHPQRLKECEIPANAWMGTTVDMQSRVANAEKAFAAVSCGVKWLSVEPLIEPLRFDRLDVFDWLVIGGASRSEKTPEWRPPYRWIEDLVRQADDAGVPVYMKTNLGIENRLIELPFDAPIEKPAQAAPDVFHYLGTKGKPDA